MIISYVTVLILQVKRGNPESEAMLFSVPDFIGFACCEVGKNELTTSPVAVMINIIASKVASGDSTLC